MSVRIAIDIGGTFTDATLIDEASGRVAIAKTLTTPTDPSEGFMRAVDRALANADVEAKQVGFVVGPGGAKETYQRWKNDDAELYPILFDAGLVKARQK